jgi:YD repeat-containing protein
LLTGTLGNHTDIVRGYDDLTSRMLSLKAIGAAPIVTPAVDIGYDYYPNSLLKTRKDNATSRGETFEYDSLLRLSKWTLKSGKSSLFTQYSYDTLGNLTEVDENQSMVEHNSYGVNGAQPHTLTDQLDVASGAHAIYAYDSLGRQTSGGGRTISAYSASDLPRTLTKNGKTWTLTYDAFGRRVKKSSLDGTTTYVGGLYERRQTSTGVQHVFHVDGTDGPVADVTYDGTTTSPGYVVSDPLGSTAVVLDSAGAVTDRFFYQPFGKRINADGTVLSGALGPMKNGFRGKRATTRSASLTGIPAHSTRTAAFGLTTLRVAEVPGVRRRGPRFESRRQVLRVAEVDPPTRRRACSTCRRPKLRLSEAQPRPPGGPCSRATRSMLGLPEVHAPPPRGPGSGSPTRFPAAIRQVPPLSPRRHDAAATFPTNPLHVCKLAIYAPASLSREDTWKTK